LVQKFSRITVYNALAVSIILYGSEVWTLKKKGQKRLTSTTMKFFRTATGYALFGHKRNFGRVESRTVDEKLRIYK